MLTLWGKGGYGGSPNVEAGERCINIFKAETTGVVIETCIKYPGSRA
jgi:hypothetical protein